MMEVEEVKVEQIDLSVYEAQERAMMDKQIVTAKSYPRNIAKVKQSILALVVTDEESARACGYALPRSGKTIKGASVHLARIVAQQYGNIRIDSKITDIDRTHVTGQATCIDLENNVGIRVEVKRRITGSDGKRFNEDMITVTGNAAVSIALRNAVFNVVPQPLVNAAYRAAQSFLLGDISDEVKLIDKRKRVMDEFLKTYGVNETQILKVLSKRSITEIGGEEIHTLIGLWQSIKDGDTTVEQSFPSTVEEPTKVTKGEKALNLVEEMAKAKMKPNKDADTSAHTAAKTITPPQSTDETLFKEEGK